MNSALLNQGDRPIFTEPVDEAVYATLCFDNPKFSRTPNTRDTANKESKMNSRHQSRDLIIGYFGSDNTVRIRLSAVDGDSLSVDITAIFT
jgi:hypothetical protein